MAKAAQVATGKDDEEDEDVPYVEVDATGKPVGGDPSLLLDDDDAGAGADDERTALGSEDAEARRKERKTRRERQSQAKDRDKNEIAQLRRDRDALAGRLSALERKSAGQDLTNIDERIAQARQLFNQAERAVAEAIAKADGNASAQAMRVRDQARDAFHGLTNLKQQAERPAAEEPQGLAPAVARRVDGFKRDHPWYDVGGADRDSKIVLALDADLAEAGYEPDTDEYWDELRDRVREQLPHRFKKNAKDTEDSGERPRRQARGGPVLSGGDGDAARPRGTYAVVTPARKQAMIEAGKWEDPVKRKRQLRAYAEYDRQHAEGARS